MQKNTKNQRHTQLVEDTHSECEICLLCLRCGYSMTSWLCCGPFLQSQSQWQPFPLCRAIKESLATCKKGVVSEWCVKGSINSQIKWVIAAWQFFVPKRQDSFHIFMMIQYTVSDTETFQQEQTWRCTPPEFTLDNVSHIKALCMDLCNLGQEKSEP